MAEICFSVAVYPRVCGGTRGVDAGEALRYGLSPRVRGNPVAMALAWARMGSIPACAGEPSPASYPVGRREVYPRVCGGTSLESNRD